MAPSASLRAGAIAIAWTIAAGAASAQLLSREEALALAYPGASIKPDRVFLTPEQQKRAADLAGHAVPSALIARYIATRDGAVVGRAYIDTHTVRTKRETLLVSLGDDGTVRRVDATAFLEPSEYQAPKPFLDQYTGRALTDDLRLQRAIRPVAGATLTANAVTQAVRRVLAIDAVLR
jgi:hypothetical protein